MKKHKPSSELSRLSAKRILSEKRESLLLGNQKGLSVICLRRTAGFGLIEALLIIIAAGIVGFGGYYVWHYQKDKSDKISNATTTENTDESANAKPDETDNWLLYVSPDKKFSIRIPDGWHLNENTAGTSGYLYHDKNILDVKDGTKAVITVPEGTGGGRGANTLLSIFVVDKKYYPDGSSRDRGKKELSLKTKSGLEIEKYYFIQTESGVADDTPIGGKEYAYFVAINNNELIRVAYSFDAEGVYVAKQTDYHENVEKMVKTIEIL